MQVFLTKNGLALALVSITGAFGIGVTGDQGYAWVSENTPRHLFRN